MLPAAADASFQAGILSDREIGLTGTDDVEALVISNSGTFFVHDQTSPEFASPFDFDTRTPGTQFVSNTSLREIFTVDGEGGDDKIRLAASGASLRADGGEGADTIVGGLGHDVIQGGLGDDLVAGREAQDVIYLGSGDDTYQWTKDPFGDDQVDGGDGDDSVELSGSAADEIFTVQGFASRVDVNVSSVTVTTMATERLALRLLDGDDLVEQELPPESLRFDIDGGSGDDYLVGGHGPDQLAGGEGVDEAFGGGGDDVISAEAIQAGAGNDRMTTELWSAVRPIVRGDGGYDLARVIGGSEDEPLSLVRKTPYVFIQSPPLLVRADSEALVLETGAGDDRVTVQPGTGSASAIAIDAGAGDDVVRGSDGLEWLVGAAGEDLVDGGPAPDRLVGGTEADVIRARDGAADAIECDEGADLLVADLGDLDRLLDGTCEHVERAASEGPLPLARVVAPNGLRLGSESVRVPVTCSAGARGGCEGTVSLVTAEPVVVGGMAAPALLGHQTLALAPGTTAEVAVPVADSEDLVRAVGGRLLDVQAQVRGPVAEHTTRLPLSILR